MSFSPAQILGLSIPSLCLFYTLSWSTLNSARPYEEEFGGDNYSLELAFESNPEGVFQRGRADQNVLFHGTLTEGARALPVSGHRYRSHGQLFYRFDLPKAQFLAQLKPGRGRCEEELYFKILNQKKVMRTGVLHAAYCH